MLIKIKNILSKVIYNKHAWLILFSIAFTFRILLIVNSNYSFLGNDSIGYNNLAVNIARGNGSSQSMSSPYIQSYFRSPAYPFFVAGCYYLYNIFDELKYIEWNKDVNDTSYGIIYNQNDLLQLKFVWFIQALISSLSIIIFFSLLRKFIIPGIAFIITFLVAVYAPLASYDLQIYRESLEAFFIILSAFFFVSFLKNGKIYWLLLFSVTCGILMQFVIIFIFLPFFAFLLYFISTYKFLKTAYLCALCILIITSIQLPWIYRTWKFYPDIRVAKTLGVCTTFEGISYFSALKSHRDKGLLSQKDYMNYEFKDGYSLSEKEIFDKSFNGYYKHKTDSLTKIWQEPIFSFINIQKKYRSFDGSWLNSYWLINKDGHIYNYPSIKYYLRKESYFMAFLTLITKIFGLLSLMGVFLFSKKLYPLLFPFYCLFLMIYFIGDEGRRLIIIHPFIILLSFLTVLFLIKYFFRKMKLKEFKKSILL